MKHVSTVHLHFDSQNCLSIPVPLHRGAVVKHSEPTPRYWDVQTQNTAPACTWNFRCAEIKQAGCSTACTSQIPEQNVRMKREMQVTFFNAPAVTFGSELGQATDHRPISILSEHRFGVQISTMAHSNTKIRRQQRCHVLSMYLPPVTQPERNHAPQISILIVLRTRHGERMLPVTPVTR
ncbi:hypothetical protein AHF37_00963 [Paragonimus kellicotti]|nr:hypothetical protein AHF37_00963 [Paragonimus kellicotti]